MLNQSMLFKLLLILLPFQAFCLDRFMIPVKNGNQKEIFIQGGMAYLSEERNSVLFYQTTECLKNGNANFYFVISNNTGDYLNFLTHNLRVTDQFGRPVRIIPKEEHLSRLQTSANWKSFFNFAIGGLDLILSQDAGRVDYSRATHRNVHGHSSHFDRRGASHDRYHHHEDVYEHGTYHCEALRRAAERESLIMTSFRQRAIHDELSMRKFRYENFYLSSNTIFPNDVYSANFQIDVPRFMQQDLQYLYFHFTVGQENHVFAIYCGNCKSF